MDCFLWFLGLWIVAAVYELFWGSPQRPAHNGSDDPLLTAYQQGQMQGAKYRLETMQKEKDQLERRVKKLTEKPPPPPKPTPAERLTKAQEHYDLALKLAALQTDPNLREAEE